MLQKPILEVKNLTKIFGRGCSHCKVYTGPDYNTNICPICKSIVACSDISFELFRGEALGIIGESGSGKSTVLKLLNFELNPTQGEMYINIPDLEGKNLFLLNSFQKKKIKNSIIGIVYQHPYLGLRMDISVGGNIAERLLISNHRNFSYIRGKAKDLLRRTEIPIERIDDLPKNFSGGMQQRIQIAKALANAPLILLLDEVTTGLDLPVQAKILDLIKNIQLEYGLSIIVVSHDIGVIRLLTTRTIVMKHGRIVEMGLTDQIIEDPQHPYTQLLVSSQL